MITTRYYYQRLSAKEKKIYKSIYDGIMQYQNQVDVPADGISNDQVGWVYHCVLWDNPFIFSVGEYAMWHALSEDKKHIKMTTLCDAGSEKAFRKKIEDEVNKVLATPGLKELNPFQKEVFVHDFIINNVKYDTTLGDGGARIQPSTTYGALVEHSAVCEGIAKTAKLLLNMLDVQCIVVSGTFDGNGHAWNIVKIEDEAYYLDVTMDMGLVIHPGMMRYNYFNFRDGAYSQYNIDNPNLMPKCNSDNGNYVVHAAGYVSSSEGLKQYIEKSLRRKKKCLYFKADKNLSGEYSKMDFKEFQQEVNKAYSLVANRLRINTSRFIDDSGPGEIMSVEITYL